MGWGQLSFRSWNSLRWSFSNKIRLNRYYHEHTRHRFLSISQKHWQQFLCISHFGTIALSQSAFPNVWTIWMLIKSHLYSNRLKVGQLVLDRFLIFSRVSNFWQKHQLEILVDFMVALLQLGLSHFLSGNRGSAFCLSSLFLPEHEAK